MDNEDGKPSIPGITEQHCITCEYQYRYANVLHMIELVKGMEEGPQSEALSNMISTEMASIMELGNEIAKKRCEGNYKAAMSVFN